MTAKKENASETEAEKGLTFYAAKKLIEKRFSFRYPAEALCSVPSKLSVSRLYPDVLDEDDTSAELEMQAEAETENEKDTKDE